MRCAAMLASRSSCTPLLEMAKGVHHIFDIAAGLALAAPDDAELLLERETAGILRVVGVDR